MKKLELYKEKVFFRQKYKREKNENVVFVWRKKEYVLSISICVGLKKENWK